MVLTNCYNIVYCSPFALYLSEDRILLQNRGYIHNNSLRFRHLIPTMLSLLSFMCSSIFNSQYSRMENY